MDAQETALSYDNARLREELAQAQGRAQQAEADYAMLRAVARRCFAEDTSDQDMLNLWNLAAAADHPGAPLIVRYNKVMAELDQWRADKERMLAVDATIREREARIVELERELDAARALIVDHANAANDARYERDQLELLLRAAAERADLAAARRWARAWKLAASIEFAAFRSADRAATIECEKAMRAEADLAAALRDIPALLDALETAQINAEHNADADGE